MVDVAQLVRAPVCGTGGRGFKSRHPPQSFLLQLFETVGRSKDVYFDPFFLSFWAKKSQLLKTKSDSFSLKQPLFN